MVRSLLLGAIAIAASTYAQETTVQYSQVLDATQPGEDGLRPRIVLNADAHPVILWGSHVPHGNYISRHDGSTFLSPIPVHVDGFEPAVGDLVGSSIAANGNTLWIVMKGMPEATSPIYVRRSNDGGAIWQDTIRVEPMNGLISDLPSIAVPEADAPVVMYMELDQGWANARQVVSRMQNGSFGVPVPISSPFASGNVCDCCPNQIVSAGDRVAGLYRNAGNNERVFWGAWSDDGGITFPYGAEVDTTGWIVFACPTSGADGVIPGDSLRYVWMSSATSGAKVYIASAHLSDQAAIGYHGRIHSVAQNIVQNFPRIAGSGDTLGVVWEQMVLGVSQVMFSWSVTGPGGLSAPDTVNIGLPGSHSAPDIEYHDGTFHIVWTDELNDQVRYRQASIINSTGIQDIHGTLSLTIHPNPATDRIIVDVDPARRIEIIDASGRVVVIKEDRAQTIDISNLQPGHYFARTISDEGYRIGKFQKL